MKVLCANSSPKNLDACLAGRIFGYKGANLLSLSRVTLCYCDERFAQVA